MDVGGGVAHKDKPVRSPTTATPRFDALSRQHAEAAVDKEKGTQGPQDDKDVILIEENKENEDTILDKATKEAVTATPVPTPTELVQLRILKKIPPPTLAEPQLQGLLQRERADMLRLIEPSQADRNPMIKLLQPVDTEFRTIDDIVLQLQLHAITTPATGNCMVMAIV